MPEPRPREVGKDPSAKEGKGKTEMTHAADRKKQSK